jgi:hypothetical protein
MTGFEYMFAGLLAKHGYLDRAVEVVRAVRDRYDGKKRNPYNEMECGSHYVRAMSRFALLPIYSGFRFDFSRGKMGFDPIEYRENYRFVWFAGNAWGNVVAKNGQTVITVLSGTLDINTLRLPCVKNPSVLSVDGKSIDFSFDNGEITFIRSKITNKVVVM